MNEINTRILIITDSLGCPREEIDVEHTWVDMILREFLGKAIIYTSCFHGQDARRFYKPYIQEINPSMIITQIGIVDASRRAFSYYGSQIISRIWGINKLIHSFARRHHYFLTRIRDIHYSSLSDFSSFFEYCLNNTNADVGFIRIAPPGAQLRNSTYNIQYEIDKYNEAVLNMKNNRIIEIDPYGNENPDSYLLDDGVHLNFTGNDMVFEACKKVIEWHLKGVDDFFNP